MLEKITDSKRNASGLGQPKVWKAGKECPNMPGSGWLERKANGEIIYHTPWIVKRKPFTMPALKPRVESAGKVLERLKKDIEKSISKLDTLDMEKCRQRAGQAAAEGWRIVVTDGHRALLEPADAGQGAYPAGSTTDYSYAVIENMEFHLTVKRALVMAGKYNAVQLACQSGVLAVSSSDEEGGFDETMDIMATGDWHIALNGTYLEPVLGVWPLSMWVKDSKSAVVFEPDDSTWRYVVMPLQV